MVITIDKINKITKLFYDEHLRPTDIAKQISVGKSYIAKIIQKDKRYIEEKEYRATKSKEKHKICKRNYINKKRQTDKQEYQMLIQINKDDEYLSFLFQVKGDKKINLLQFIYQYFRLVRRFYLMEPLSRIELLTYGLRIRCSTN